MELAAELKDVVARRRDEVALALGRRRRTYGELWDSSSALVDALRCAGVGDGHAVASLTPAGDDVLATLLAASRIGAAFVPLDPGMPEGERERTAALFGGRWHLVGPGEVLVGAASAVEFAGGQVMEASGLGAVGALSELVGMGAVVMTSGSSGDPKGILIDHQRLVLRSQIFADAVGMSEGDRTLCTLPLSHCHGLECLALPTLLRGGQVHLIPPHAAAPTTVLGTIERERITFFSSVPGFYDRAVRLPEGRSYDLGSLRHAFCGSAALAPSTAHKFEARFARPILQGYGLAEIGATHLNFDAPRTGKVQSVGRPYQGMRCRLTDEGEVVLGSQTLAQGYLGDEDAWEARVRGDEIWTGDLGELDEDGDLFLVGRRSRKINLDGMEVHPSEIETALVSVPWVEAAAVVGCETRSGRLELLAHLVLTAAAPEAFEEPLAGHLRSELSPHKIPRRFAVHEALPTSPLGKVLPAKLPADPEQLL